MVVAAVKKLGHALGQAYVRKLIGDEIQTQKFKFHTERSVEYAYVFNEITRVRPKTALDVGTGLSPLPALLSECGCVVTAVDNIVNYWDQPIQNRHWSVTHDDIRETQMTERFDLVTCISVLEHIDRPAEALRSMSKLLAAEGRLVLTMPYNERRHVDNVYELRATMTEQSVPYFCRSANRADLDNWLTAVRLTIERQEYWRIWEGDVWRQGAMVERFKQVGPEDAHQLTCLTLMSE